MRGLTGLTPQPQDSYCSLSSSSSSSWLEEDLIGWLNIGPVPDHAAFEHLQTLPPSWKLFSWGLTLTSIFTFFISFFMPFSLPHPSSVHFICSLTHVLRIITESTYYVLANTILSLLMITAPLAPTVSFNLFPNTTIHMPILSFWSSLNSIC